MSGTRHCGKDADICEELEGPWGDAAVEGLGRSPGGGERQPHPAWEGRGSVHPLVVALGTEACRRAGFLYTTPCPQPLQRLLSAPFSL